MWRLFGLFHLARFGSSQNGETDIKCSIRRHHSLTLRNRGGWGSPDVGYPTRKGWATRQVFWATVNFLIAKKIIAYAIPMLVGLVVLCSGNLLALRVKLHNQQVQFWSTFLLYFEWAAEFLWMPPFVFVTGGLSVAAFLALWRMRTAIKQCWRPLHWLMFAQFAAIPAVVAFAVLGTISADPSVHQEPHKWARLSTEIIWWSSLTGGPPVVFVFVGVIPLWDFQTVGAPLLRGFRKGGIQECLSYHSLPLSSGMQT